MQFNVRNVLPELPEQDKWLHFAQPSIEANWHTNFGPVNALFEERLENLYGFAGEKVVTASSATSGLTACLISEEISGPVLCPAFTFQATASAIMAANCYPVIIDVSLQNGVIDPYALEAGIRKCNAKAVVVVIPYGIRVDLRAHAAVCQQLGVLLVIDNAAGLGVDRKPTFPYEDVVREVFSLHATKPFGIGEGCAIFAPVSKSQRIRAALNFGLSSHTHSGDQKPPFWGINGKMSELHAAVGLGVAMSISQRVRGRQKMVRNWVDSLGDCPVTLFNSSPNEAPWQVFPILLETQYHIKATIELAKKKGIELRQYYSPSLGDCAVLKKIGICLNARTLAARALALPVRSFMSETEQDDLIKSIKECILGAHLR